MKTKSGRHVIFDATSPEFLKGQLLSKDFVDAAPNGEPWFFQPADWNEENFWGGLYSRKSPFAYSPGYASAEEALEAAEGWESRRKS